MIRKTNNEAMWLPPTGTAIIVLYSNKDFKIILNTEAYLKRPNQNNWLHRIIDPKIHASIQSNSHDWSSKTPVQANNSIAWQGFSVYIYYPFKLALTINLALPSISA